MPEATINGFRMVYEVTGKGPPVTFVHGGFGGIESRFSPRRPWWVDELFAPHFTVVTYDRRGCGRSQAPEDGYDLENFADDLRGLLDHIGIERTYLIGSSAGGPIAIQFALIYPEAVDRLVLANTAADLLSGEQAAPLHAVLERRRAAGAEALPEVPPDADPQTRAQVEHLRGSIAAIPLAERVQAFETWQRNVLAYESIDLAPALSRLKMRVFVVHGAADDVVPRAAAYSLAHRIDRVSMRVIADEGHGLMSRPDSAAPRLTLDWLLTPDALG